MDEMRKMLDSLMGQSRDASLEEAKQNKGKNFTKSNVCKPYLLGFCPQHELANSKLTTKRNLGECTKVHSDAMKKEFEESPENNKYRAEYEKAFLPFLESQVREADAWVSRERANTKKTEAGEKATISTMPANVQEQVASLNDDINKLMAAAEERAEAGDVEGSKFKVMLAEEIKDKVKEIEDQHPSYTVTLKEEWVCEVCGTRTEAVTEKNHARFAAHFTGKVHIGYAKIREWVKELRNKQRDGDEPRRRSRSRKRRSRSGRGDRREPRDGDGEPQKESRAERPRDQKERTREADWVDQAGKRRSRSRSRERRRGGAQDGSDERAHDRRRRDRQGDEDWHDRRDSGRRRG